MALALLTPVPQMRRPLALQVMAVEIKPAIQREQDSELVSSMLVRRDLIFKMEFVLRMLVRRMLQPLVREIMVPERTLATQRELVTVLVL